MSKEFVDFSKWNLEKQASQFQSATPFNYIVIDDFLNQSILKDILNDFDNQDFSTWDKRNHDKIQIKWRSDWKDDNDVPENTRNLIQYFNSGNFLRYLSKITGIQGIIPDPYLTGGGFNQINQGGTLAVHADGNWHDLMGVHRRLNVILYLNEDWQDEWGGHLELWSKTKDNNPNRCEEKISPLLNRLVIFRTDDFSFHGHPTPLKCPDDRSRRSLILYYYTNTRPLDEVVDINLKHRALFHNPEDIGVKYDI
jgi:Rps23 Pro-64 3,4-dihydroxylase Tpa1-like proline 4-hydroxylase